MSQELILSLLTNPLIQGMILGQVKSFLEAAAKQVDAEKLAEKNKVWLQPALVVLTLITTGITLALEGHLNNPDFLTNVQNYLLVAANMYLGARATQAAGSKTVTNLAKKVVK